MNVLTTQQPSSEWVELPTLNAGPLYVQVQDAANIFAGGTTATSTTLAALPNVPAGTQVYVTSRQRAFESVPAGNGQIAGTGNDWNSIPETSNPLLLIQGLWFISQSVGSDDNTGLDAAHPIKTVGELQARWGGESGANIGTSPSIIFLDSGPGGTLKWNRTQGSSTVFVVGNTTTVATDTVGTYADISNATNKWSQMTGTAILDFTPHINNQIFFTTGAAAGAFALISKVSPQGVGNGTAQVNPPLVGPVLGNNFTPVQSNPAPGDGFQMVSVPALGQLVLDVNDAGGNSQAGATAQIRPAFTIQNLNATVIGTRVTGVGSSQRQLFCCSYNNWSDSTASQRNATVNGCKAIMNQNVVTPAVYRQHAVTSVDLANLQIIFVYDQTQLFQTVFQGVRAVLQGGLTIAATVGAFDSPATGITLNGGAIIACSGNILGQGNTTFGLSCNRNAQVILRAGVTMKITGTTGDWCFDGAAPVFTWAQAPRAHGFGSGTDTLAGGTKVVSVPNLPADAKIVATINTPTGVGAPGILSAPTASHAASAFTVNSSVGTDASTFDYHWSSPTGGNGGIFAG